MDPYWQWHFQELFKRTDWLADKELKTEARLLAIEAQLQAISSQLEDISKLLSGMEERPSTRIDKIEYRFEQLKVDTLSGALHIGMAQGVEGLIEDLEAGGKTAQNLELGDDSQEEQYTRAMAVMQEYIGAGLHQDIVQAAEAAGVQLDPELHDKIASDLARQAEQRFMLYIKENPFRAGEDKEAPNRILEKVRQDVRDGLKQYMEGYGKEDSP